MADGDTRPQLAEPRGDGNMTVRKIFENEKIVRKLQSAVPRHLNPERMLRTFSLAIQKTPKLAECDPLTLLGAMMVLASLGLEPNTPLGHAYLIPFEKRRRRGQEWVTDSVDVNVIIGYKGYIDLGRRSGNLVSLHADVVYGAAGNMRPDEFSFEYGSNMHLRHVPIGDNEGRPPIWAYAHASLKDGQAFEVLPYERVLRIRNSSQGYQAAVRAREGQYGENATAWKTAPWVAYEHEMVSKTLIRRLAKMLPLSIEFANAAALDAMSETGEVDLGAFADGVDMTSMDIGDARVIEHSDEQPLNTAAVTETGDKQAQPAQTEQKQPRRGRPAGTPNKPKEAASQDGPAGPEPPPPEGTTESPAAESSAQEHPSQGDAEGGGTAAPAAGEPQESGPAPSGRVIKDLLE